jgi:hypothetical protein
VKDQDDDHPRENDDEAHHHVEHRSGGTAWEPEIEEVEAAVIARGRPRLLGNRRESGEQQ